MASLSRTQQAKLAEEIQSTLPPAEWDQVADLKSWREEIEIKGKKKKLTFDEMVNLDRDLTGEIEYREGIRKQLRDSIKAAMAVADTEKVLCEGYNVAIVTREGSRKIVPEKLVELGVSPTTIAQATEIGPSSSFVNIRAAKKEKRT